MATREEIRAALAEALGEEAGSIRATNPRWLQLLREGVVVQLHIGRWRARTSLSWEDLGIRPGEENEDDERDVLEELVELGHKLLLPRDVVRKLDSVESKARKWLDKCAVRTFWGWFVHVGSYQEWKERNSEFEQEYMSLMRELAASWDDVRARVLARYHVQARQAFRRLRTLYPGAMPDKSEGQFADDFVAQIAAVIPTRKGFEDSFYYTVELSFIPMPTLLAEEQAEADLIGAEARAEAERLGLALDLERDRAWAERERLRADVDAARSAAEWKEELMRRMHADVVVQAQRRKEETVDRFLEDVVKQLCGTFYEACRGVLATSERNGGRLHPRSVTALNNLVEWAQRVNFIQLEDIDRAVAELQSHLKTAAEDRSAEDVMQVVRDIATTTRATLVTLGEAPRSARRLGVPDTPEPAVLRRARARLGAEETTGGPQLPQRRVRRLRRAGDDEQMAMGI